MNRVLRKSESLEGTVTVALTQRDLLLLDLCLGLIARHYAQKGTLSFDIQSLRDKLPTQQWAPDDSTTGIKNGNQIQKRSKERR